MFKGTPHRLCDSIDPFQPNEGPKRGVGKGPIDIYSLLPHPGGNGPKRGRGQAPEITPPKYDPILPSKTTAPRPITPLKLDPLQPHEGPKRGFGLGPAAYYKPELGPKRGIGPGPGMDILKQYETGAGKDEQLCVRLTNEFRKKNGLPPLKFNKLLADISMPHTLAMLDGKYPLSHKGFKERSAKVQYARATGENVAYNTGYSKPVEVMVEGWIKSPGHRANMLGNFNAIGVSFAKRGSTWYGTQFFALL